MSVQQCDVCDFLQMDRQEDHCIRCERDALARAIDTIEKYANEWEVLEACKKADAEVAEIQLLGYGHPADSGGQE